jgi:hypothetical protein
MTGAGSAANGRFFCVAVLAVGLVIGAGSQAEAARYYWSDGEPDFYQPSPRPSSRPHKARHGQAQKTEKPERGAAKPQGPLIIAISINQQRLKVYDAQGVFAESPVSTGMRGHSTPMGVFSVIQKHKFHRSNIYSNAPMPYMQRITWSGVAMHAGVLPGYPASHGCIRMPMAFAIKMWNWTRMGARVVVTPGELTPATFAHALLPSQKVVPQATSAAAANVGADLALRTSLGQDDSVKTAPSGMTPPLREQTHTADAGGDTKASQITMSDASSGSSTPRHEDGAAQSESIPSASADTAQPATASEAKADDRSGAKAGDKAGDKSIDAKIDPKTDPKTDPKLEAKPEATKIEPAKAAERAASANDKDQAPLTDAAKDNAKETDEAAAVKTDPPRRAGQIAVFISRKDSKLYVRQNFAPLFEVPVTIAPSDRPLGTHVFTADVDRKDTNLLHWSVVTLPVSARSAARAADDAERGARRKSSAAVEAKAVAVADTPAEALDRIGIPADAMTRVSDALTSGGSIIVSDQGINQGETGEGTDFIVSLH